MACKLTYTDRFIKHYLTLTAKEKSQLRNKLDLLTENPSHPSLRTKRIQGTEKLYERSINMDIRVIWFYEGTAMIVLLDVGHHDILRRL